MTDKKPTPKVFDVSKPGKSAPSSSGKPIIITNRPVLQDPMMVEDKPADADPSADTSAVKPSSRLVISPIHDDGSVKPADSEPQAPSAPAVDSAAKAAAETDPDVTKTAAKPEPTVAELAVTAAAKKAKTDAKATPAEPVADPAPEAEPSPTAEREPAEATAEPDTTTSDEPADDDVPDNTPKSATAIKADEIAARQQAERAAELDRLAESHKYYLPINQVEKRKNKQYAIAGIIVILLLGAAWADISLDAGIIHLGHLKPLTHFFFK